MKGAGKHSRIGELKLLDTVDRISYWRADYLKTEDDEDPSS